MLNQVEEASYVLVVCTETYNARFRGKERAGVGKGAKWEGAVITQGLYDSEQYNTHFIPVLLASDDEKHIPVVLRGVTYYNLTTNEGYLKLFRRLTRQPEVRVPPVGRVRNLSDAGMQEAAARKFDEEIAIDVSYYTAKLGTWPQKDFEGGEVIPALSATLEKVESNPEYRERHSNITATIYRMLGGAYLIHAKLDMGDKLRAALPQLKRSLEIWPDQEFLDRDVTFLETFLRNQGGDTKEYLTVVLRILRGPRDPLVPELVERMSQAMGGPEVQARQWLLHQATPNPIWNFLMSVQIMLKKERNIAAEIEVTSRTLPDTKIEVQAKIGPNVFLWDVDYARKEYAPKNDLTTGFMGLIEGANA